MSFPGAKQNETPSNLPKPYDAQVTLHPVRRCHRQCVFGNTTSRLRTFCRRWPIGERWAGYQSDRSRGSLETTQPRLKSHRAVEKRKSFRARMADKKDFYHHHHHHHTSLSFFAATPMVLKIRMIFFKFAVIHVVIVIAVAIAIDIDITIATARIFRDVTPFDGRCLIPRDAFVVVGFLPVALWV